ncbi:MAG: FtsX-like permease family protein [Anaerolineae bacterium]|nr:FtsX-like permease family protein [Anaerolineae bacterium]
MILKYVLKNFRRRKVRTALMVLALIVSTGLIVAMSATVETIRRSNINLIAQSTGRYDLTVRPAETSVDPFVRVGETRQRMLAADERITAVYPRFLSEVELTADGRQSTGVLLALDPAEKIGQVDVISGSYELGNMQAAVLQPTALELGNLHVGDAIDVAYSFPQSREKGSIAPSGSSRRRAVGRFMVGAIVRQNGVTSAGVRGGVIVHIDDAQAFLGLPDRAEELIALVEPALYEAGNADKVALLVRDVAIHVQAALGDEYVYRLDKAQALDGSAEMFLVIQALISTYGLMSLGVVGLLVYTLVMTNVQEQRREMAILRILGSQRNLLFGIVAAEVAVIGLVGAGLGIVAGQGITAFVVVPLIEYLLSQEGQVATLQPAVSVGAILPAVVSGMIVLLVSAIKPAREAARTKVVHAINPGVADNVQLEDLDALRERRPTLRLFVIGVAMMLVVGVAAGLIFAVGFENPVALAALALTVLLFTVVGLVFCFFTLTRPLEKLILLVTGLISPRLTYFARRNVARSTERNTLISLLVLFSGVLPSFLATETAMSNANVETAVRLNMGAPVQMQIFRRGDQSEFAALYRLRPSFVSDELREIPGIDRAVGLTYEYRTEVSDAVAMRRGWVTLVGVTGDLNDVVYADLTILAAGGPAALAHILDDPRAVVISQGMAEGLAVPLGGTIRVQGEGLDHEEELTVVGIARRVPGFDNVGSIRSQALAGGTAFVSLGGFRRLATDPRKALPGEDDPVLVQVLATTTADADPSAVEVALHEAFDRKYGIWTRLAKVQLEYARDSRVQQQVFLLVLTLLSFVTAVFGVFAVIYVTIYARRREIGMMKAVGACNWELNGILSVESIAMTLSAALAGILAGSTAGYLFAFALNIAEQRPQQFAVDTTVMPFVVLVGTLASILGTVFSARRIIKRKAIEILRMS